MEANLFKQTVVNTLAGAANVDTATLAGYALITGLDPIVVADIVSVTHDTYAAEVQQYITVTMPTIVADTVYGLQAGSLGETGQEWFKRLRPYRHTTLATLSGTALIDQQNVINNIAYKMNNSSKLNVWAGQIAPVTVHGATTPVGGFDANTIVTGSVTGTSMLVISSTATSFVGIVLNGIYPTVADLVFSGTTGGVASASASGAPTVTAAAGTMAILDKPGYFEQGTLRKGKTTVIAGDNILDTAVVETTAAVYQFGEGAEMLKIMPTWEPSTGRIASGLWHGPNTQYNSDLFVAGNNYDRSTILYTAQSEANAATQHPRRNVEQAIWYQTGDAAKAAFVAALDAL